jgi:NAD(P)-dependent dehydrogenase (short-subunit alcohol dehydrogenase family)
MIGKQNARPPVCVVVGVGPGSGAAFAKRFAAERYLVALIARHAEPINMLAAQLPNAKGYVCDVTDSASVESAFARIRAELGDPDALIYNAGKGVWGDVEKVTAQDFEDAWRSNTLGAFLAVRQVIPAMKARKRGDIIFTGATASRRGVAGAAAFAPAKAAQKSLAESLARYLGPTGVHVALIIVDGAVGGEETRAQFKDRADDQFISPEAVADIAHHLTRQDRSAWSFEVDARPFNEKW